MEGVAGIFWLSRYRGDCCIGGEMEDLSPVGVEEVTLADFDRTLLINLLLHSACDMTAKYRTYETRADAVARRGHDHKAWCGDKHANCSHLHVGVR